MVQCCQFHVLSTIHLLLFFTLLCNSHFSSMQTNMSSDFFMLDLFNSDETRLLTESDPFSALSESSIESFILQELSEEPNTNTVTDPYQASNLDQFDSFSIYQQTHFTNRSDSLDFSCGYVSSPVSAIKTEEFFPGLNSRDCVIGEEEKSMGRLIERNFSYGSRSYGGEKPWMAFQPKLFDALFNGQMTRVCSYGDLSDIKGNEASATTLMEEGNLKVGKYSAEERKEKIERYRAKRNQRNFNKTIKYACRKTLADSRPRVRGRFARNDVVGEISKATTTCLNAYEDEDNSLVWTLHDPLDHSHMFSSTI